MKHSMRIVKLAALVSILGFGGCSKDKAEAPRPQSKVYTAEDHNRIYQEACDLISPYMRLQGVDAPAADSEKARDELHRGISLLHSVVELKPDNWAAYWVMGKGYQALDQPEDACDAFGKSFSIQKENPDVAREYMLECLKLGRAPEAIEAAKHGVSLNPRDAGLVANLAAAYLFGGRIDEAVTTVNESLELAPDDEITQKLKEIILEVRDGKRPQPKSVRDLEGK